MIDLKLLARRGSFTLDVQCQLAAPWTIVFGPSGAGKSTLLRLIAGLEQPDSGHIAVNGPRITDAQAHLHIRPGTRPHQRAIGMVTQNSALFPHMSVENNIAYGIPGSDHQTRQSKIQQMLDLVGGTHLAQRRPRALSGGEAQRVSLARALAPLPRLLLLDEPLSALDAAARDEVLLRLQPWLADQKIQVILVTHDAADALATEAEVALLQEGKLTALGPAHQVLATERDRLIQRLSVGNFSKS
jgi:ABC-type Fe3+/spermidine/putrescine transport system ATPase subunit